MRRFLVGLAVLALAVVTIVLVTSGGDEDPTGETLRGLPGFPLRGSLAGDPEAIDGAVATWRTEIEDGDEQPGDPEPDDPITVVWIGELPSGLYIAILESDGLLAELARFEDGWTVRDERLRGWGNRSPIAINHSIVVPEGTDWAFRDAGPGDGFKDAADGLYSTDSSREEEGFLTASPATAGDRVPVYVVGGGAGGARGVPKASWSAFADALNDEGDRRAVWLAARALTDQAGTPTYAGDPPALTVAWTGEVPGEEHAALVTQRDDTSLGAALGYAVEGGLALGTGPAGDTFAAGVYTEIDSRRSLVLAGGGDVETIEAQVGAVELRRDAPLAVIDARRFDDDVDPVVTGRTRDGEIVAGLERAR
jgi:hypothetical protein